MQGLKWKYDPIEVRKWSAMGLTNEQIAACCKIRASTFQAEKANNPEFAAICEEGRAAGVLTYAEALLRAATEKGDIKAITFYLERRGGWKAEDKGGNVDSLVQLLLQKELQKRQLAAQDETDVE